MSKLHCKAAPEAAAAALESLTAVAPGVLPHVPALLEATLIHVEKAGGGIQHIAVGDGWFRFVQNSPFPVATYTTLPTVTASAVLSCLVALILDVLGTQTVKYDINYPHACMALLISDMGGLRCVSRLLGCWDLPQSLKAFGSEWLVEHRLWAWMAAEC
jgi:hypothetical protein